MTFEMTADRSLIRNGYRSHRYLHVRLAAPSAPPRSGRLPLNAGFVLDRSGSMDGQKLRLVKQAVRDGLERLEAADTFSITMYDNEVDVLVPGMAGSAEGRSMAAGRLAGVEAGGSTNLCEGWLRGAEQVALRLADGSVARVFLLTDGLANVGITDPVELERHASELRRRGIATTAFGVGADFDEHLLARLAAAGGGNFYYIETARQIPDFISSELGEALEVVARAAGLEVRAPDGVEVESLGPEPVERRDATTWWIALGDLVSGQLREIVLRLRFPYGRVDGEHRVEVAVRDRDGAFAGQGGSITWRYADDRSNDQQPRDRGVDWIVASRFAARARAQAAELNRAGDFDAAMRALTGVANRIRRYALEDPRFIALADDLEQDGRRRFAAPIAPLARKAVYAASMAELSGRDIDGKARRI
jgi:Ca-activated chloride channel family protein